jgi:hypothetical protein
MRVKDIATIFMVLGVHDLQDAKESFRCFFLNTFPLFSSRKVLPCSAIIYHEGYTGHFSNEFYHPGNDIALIRVTDPVDLTVYTPACLPHPDYDYAELYGSWTWYGKPWMKFWVELVGKLPRNDRPLRWATVTGLLYTLS